MTAKYTLVDDLAQRAEMPADGTLSRTLLQDDHLKVVLFSFSAGQELSEHTSAVPAIMHFLQGEADVTLGADAIVATTGTWVHMPAQLPHSIRAKSPLVMLLTMLKSPQAK